MLLKFAAFVVIAFFVALYASGNNLQSIKHGINAWADDTSRLTAGDPDDWENG